MPAGGPPFPAVPRRHDAGMDPALAFVALGAPPAHADAQVLVLPGAWLPVLLPLACLPPQVRAQALARVPDCPPAVQTDADLAIGDTAAAWAVVRSIRVPLVAPDLVHVLSLWAAQEQAQLGLPAPLEGAAQVLSGPPDGAAMAVKALGDVHGLLDPWPWPRWVGPLLVVGEREATQGLGEGDPFLARPVLPLVRIPHDPSRSAWAARLTQLSLALSAPPPQGWPPFLTLGLTRLAEARGAFQVVSPEHLHGVRAAAGAAGIATALRATNPDPELATALAAFLLHPQRRALLSSALDLLRSGATAQAMFAIAYGLDLAQVAQAR